MIRKEEEEEEEEKKRRSGREKRLFKAAHRAGAASAPRGRQLSFSRSIIRDLVSKSNRLPWHASPVSKETTRAVKEAVVGSARLFQGRAAFESSGLSRIPTYPRAFYARYLILRAAARVV